MRASIVIGANFGDEGKGFVTSTLAKEDDNSIVIRFNGGAQAGHTVFHNNRKLTFHHFGSGTHLNRPTYLSEFFIVNPILFNKELHDLKIRNITPNVIVNGNCLVTFPHDMILNQLRERKRAKDNSKHGSCGVGIFETISRNDKKVKNLKKHLDLLQGWFELLTSYLYNKLKSEGLYIYLTNSERDVLDFGFEKFSEEVQQFLHNVTVVSSDQEVLNHYDELIFEGAQGLLLDQNNHDFFPHLTPSNTGSINPIKILKNIDFFDKDNELITYYVTRPYMTRHGEGPFPTEYDKFKEKYLVEDTQEINVNDGVQGKFRYGFLDKKLLRKTIDKDLQEYQYLKLTNAIKNLKETYFETQLIVTCRKHVKEPLCHQYKIPVKNNQHQYFRDFFKSFNFKRMDYSDME